VPARRSLALSDAKSNLAADDHDDSRGPSANRFPSWSANIDHQPQLSWTGGWGNSTARARGRVARRTCVLIGSARVALGRNRLRRGELNVRGQLQPAKRDRPARWVPLLKSAASARTVPLFPAVTAALVEQLADEQTACRGAGTDLVFCSRTGRPLVHRNVAQRGVENAASRAGLGKVTPHDLRRSFCSLAGRRGVDPVEAAQITGHSPAVWARFYARSFGKAQRDEARDRLLEYGFGAVSDAQGEGPLAPRSHGSPSDDELSREVEAEAQETPADEEVPEDGAYRDRTGDLRLANPTDSPTRPDNDRQNRHD
jgi:hypothetical protein